MDKNGLWCTREASRRECRVRRRAPVHTGASKTRQLCAEEGAGAHGRRFCVADGGKAAGFRTQEAEWQLTPGGRGRPRLVSGRGPAVRLGRIGRRPYPVGVSCLPRHDKFRCADKDTSAQERWFCEAVGGKATRLRTREAEWWLTPGGRSRPRLVSGR